MRFVNFLFDSFLSIWHKRQIETGNNVMTASAWNTILTAPELDAHYALTASLDPRFAKGERTFYESRTPTQLRVLAAQAWDCNEPTAYQLARSHAALVEV